MVFYIMDIIKSEFNQNGFYEVVSTEGKIKFGELYRCPECKCYIAPKPWLPPINIRLRGKYLGDLCAYGTYEFFVSKKFVTLWKESGLTGLEIFDYPVNIKKTGRFKKMEPPEYIMVKPEVTFTLLDEKESGLVIKKLVGCDKCRVAQRTKIERLSINENTWHGQDIFYPTGLCGDLVVTEKFVEFVEKNQFTNFVFIHQDDYHFDTAVS